MSGRATSLRGMLSRRGFVATACASVAAILGWPLARTEIDRLVSPGSTGQVMDSFGRGVTNGWGTADIGGSYTVLGDDANYAVRGTAGHMTLESGATRGVTLGEVTAGDVDLRARVRTDRAPTGTGLVIALVARRNDDGAEYRCRLHLLPNGAATLSAIRSPASTVALGRDVIVPNLLHVPGQAIWLRAQVIGSQPTTIRLKAWPMDDAEPYAWHVTVTDDDATLSSPGAVGLRAALSRSADDTPVVVSVDELRTTTSETASRPAPPSRPTIAWWPYLQRSTATSVVIRWSTREADRPIVLYSADADSWSHVDGSTRHIDALAMDLHEVKLDALEPNTTYAYRVFAGATELLPGARLTVRTAPPTGSGDPFTFIAFGDYGETSAPQLRLRNQMLRDAFDFVVTTGDNAYPNGAFVEFDQNVMAVYRQIFSRVALFPTIGDHDYLTDAAAVYLDVFDLPQNAWRIEDRGRYYSFDYGNVHFVVLDSEDPLRKDDPTAVDGMLTWLHGDLERTRQPWKVATIHRPAYSAGRVHGPSGTVRSKVVPILERYGVDLVLSGHDHTYQRSRPLRNGQVTTRDRGGIVYIVSGGGGMVSYGCDPADWLVATVSNADRETALYSRIRVAGDRMLIEAIDHDGVIRDRYDLRSACACNYSQRSM